MLAFAAIQDGDFIRWNVLTLRDVEHTVIAQEWNGFLSRWLADVIHLQPFPEHDGTGSLAFFDVSAQFPCLVVCQPERGLIHHGLKQEHIYAPIIPLALMFASESYRNCLETERLLMKDIRNAEIPARDRAVCANALDRILERKRILRMKPAPKAVDANEYEKHRKKLRAPPNEPAFVETRDLRPPVTPAFAERPVRRSHAAGGNGSATSSDIPSEQRLGSEEDER